jgi:hypothetical protein
MLSLDALSELQDPLQLRTSIVALALRNPLKEHCDCRISIAIASRDGTFELLDES